MKKKQVIPYGQKLPVYFTPAEIKLIREHTFVDPDFGRVAPVEKNKVRLDLSLDDIEEVQGYVAAAANHSRSQRLMHQLDKICDRLQTFLDQYDDQV